MAQGKRKLPKGKVKLSREESLQLQYAKRAGLISSRTKTDKGIVTRAAQRKLDTLRTLQAVPTYEFREGSKRSTRHEPVNKPVKLTRSQRAEYRQHNYPTFNGFAVAENPREARDLLASGKLVATLPPLTGSNPIRVVSLGRIRTFADLKAAAEDGALDKLKNPSDLFSFTINDYSPNPARLVDPKNKRSAYVHDNRNSVFFDGAEMTAYLQAYDFMKSQGDLNSEDVFLIFELYRIQEGRNMGRTPDYVFERKRASGELHERKKAKRKSRALAQKQIRTRISYTEQLDRDRDRHEAARRIETPEHKANRLAKQRDRDRKRRGK